MTEVIVKDPDLMITGVIDMTCPSGDGYSEIVIEYKTGSYVISGCPQCHVVGIQKQEEEK